jgi:hypothetical protein
MRNPVLCALSFHPCESCVGYCDQGGTTPFIRA